VHRGRHALEFTALALADVYGPRQRPDAGIVAAVVADPHGVVADPRWQLDAVYVDDAVDALVRATTRGSGLLVNVGTGQAVSAKELQRRVVELRAAHRVPPRGDDEAIVVRTRQQRLTLSPVRARIHLGWEAYTPFAEGVAATVAAWAEHVGVPPVDAAPASAPDGPAPAAHEAV
jgi:UDP-glucose 4-epimerase